MGYALTMGSDTTASSSAASVAQMQLPLIREPSLRKPAPPRGQLLKWIGNKQRLAPTIISFFPKGFGTYYEPFLGSGGVLATLAPESAAATDSFEPLIEIWQTLQCYPDTLKRWYADRWQRMMAGDKVGVYEDIKASYNARPNGADLVFLCRACYGGVVRFRQADGYMSTPCGPHRPIAPEAFSRRVDEWRFRVEGAKFGRIEYEAAMGAAQQGDLVYCDPPYSHSQSILYGAQSFSLEHLLEVISRCKERGVFVALSIDGVKRSGKHVCELPIPEALFEREALINCGRSMLKRFQMNGKTLEEEVVTDRLLLTY